MKVHVVEARNLTAADSNTFSEDSSDPYVLVFLSSDEEKQFQTQTVEESLAPSWGESFEFDGVSLPDAAGGAVGGAVGDAVGDAVDIAVAVLSMLMKAPCPS